MVLTYSENGRNLSRRISQVIALKIFYKACVHWSAILLVVLFAGCSANTKIDCDGGILTKSSFEKLPSTTNSTELESLLVGIANECALSADSEKLFLDAAERYARTAESNRLIDIYKSLEKSGSETFRIDFLTKTRMLGFVKFDKVIPIDFQIIDVSEIGKSINEESLTGDERFSLKQLQESDSTDIRIVNLPNSTDKYLIQFHWDEFSTTVTIDNITNSSYKKSEENSEIGLERPQEYELNTELNGKSGHMKAMAVTTKSGEFLGLARVGQQLTQLEGLSSYPETKCFKKYRQFIQFTKTGFDLIAESQLPCDSNADDWQYLEASSPKFEEWWIQYEKDLNIELNAFIRHLSKTDGLQKVASLINYNRMDSADKLIIKELKTKGLLGRSQLANDFMHRYSLLFEPITNVDSADKMSKQLKALFPALEMLDSSEMNFDISEASQKLADIHIAMKQYSESSELRRNAENLKSFNAFNVLVVRQIDGGVNYGGQSFAYQYLAYKAGSINHPIIIASNHLAFSGRGFSDVIAEKIGEDTLKQNQDLGGFITKADVYKLATKDEAKLFSMRNSSHANPEKIVKLTKDLEEYIYRISRKISDELVWMQDRE